VKAQKQIQDTEASLGASDMVSVELASLVAEKEEKRARLKRSEKSRAQANYETRSSEIASQTSKLEEQREALSNELQYMSAHSESRAKLDLKQDEVRRKRLELKATYVRPFGSPIFPQFPQRGGQSDENSEVFR
jgi:hypothetical protein